MYESILILRNKRDKRQRRESAEEYELINVEGRAELRDSHFAVTMEILN